MTHVVQMRQLVPVVENCLRLKQEAHERGHQEAQGKERVRQESHEFMANKAVEDILRALKLPRTEVSVTIRSAGVNDHSSSRL